MNRRNVVKITVCCFSIFPSVVISAEMKSTPEIPVWVADGITEYRLFIWIENTGLEGEPTDGVQWRLNNVPNLTYVDGSCSAPVVDNFFAENHLFIVQFRPPGVLSGLIVAPEEIGFGPVDSSGNVAEYLFTVPKGFAGIHAFTLTDTDMMGPSTVQQPHTVSNDSITITPKIQPDLNNDGYVNNEDYAILEPCIVGPDETPPSGCEETDFNDDGAVDLKDFASFQRCYTGDIPVSDPDCSE